MTQRPILFLFIFSLLICALFALMFDVEHVIYLTSSLADQLNYIGVARNLVNYGHFIQHGLFEGTGNIIIPGLLTSEATRIYVPGFYLILAGFIKIFGYSGFVAVLPNMAMYSIGGLLLFHIGKRLYDTNIGLWSAIIFLLLPLNVFTGFTCMGDIALPFAAISAFVLFIHIPQKYRAYSIPLLVGSVYLFRQTGLMLLIPLLGYYLDHCEKNKLWKALLIAISSFIFCHFLSSWQNHMGEAQIHFIDVLSLGHLDYTNAFPDISNVKALSSMDIIKLVLQHFLNNASIFFKSFNGIKPDINFLAEASFFSMLIMLILATTFSIRHIKREYFAFSCCLFLLAVAGADMVYYLGSVRVLIRMSMISFPFVILQAVRSSRNNTEKNRSILLFTFYCLISLYAIQVGSHKLRGHQKYVKQFHNFIKKVNPSPVGLVATPTMFFRPYAFDHYPQLMSFVPKNKKTLILLNQKYPITTLVIPENDLNKTLTEKDLNSIGLQKTDRIKFWDDDYIIFKSVKKEN